MLSMHFDDQHVMRTGVISFNVNVARTLGQNTFNGLLINWGCTLLHKAAELAKLR